MSFYHRTRTGVILTAFGRRLHVTVARVNNLPVTQKERALGWMDGHVVSVRGTARKQAGVSIITDDPLKPAGNSSSTSTPDAK